MTPKEFAALAAPVLLAQVFEEATQMWTCRRCGGQTSRLSEMCAACGVEDCEQGGQQWSPE